MKRFSGTSLFVAVLAGMAFGMGGMNLLRGQTPATLPTAVANKKPVESAVLNLADLKSSDTGIGTHRDLFDGPSRTLLNLEGHITTLNPGEISHPAHQHVNEELVILTKGKLECAINGKKTIADAGSVMFFASNDWHNVKSIGSVPAEYYVLNWQSQLKPGFVEPVIAKPDVREVADPKH